MPLTDQPNHEMSIGEVSGTQKSADPLWNNSKITYWGATDLLDGKGSQHGSHNNVHADKGRDWGTFEGKVTAAGGAMTVEGTYKFTGGDGKYRGLTGGGKFKTVMKSETEPRVHLGRNYEWPRRRRVSNETARLRVARRVWRLVFPTDRCSSAPMRVTESL